MKMLTKNGDEFEVRVEMMDITSNHVPDLSWKAVDRNGHVHAWQRGPVHGDLDATLPTMKYVVDTSTEAWCEDCQDIHQFETGHWECAQCGEPLPDPRYTADTCRRYAPGMKTYLVNGQSVSPVEFERLLAEAKKA